MLYSLAELFFYYINGIEQLLRLGNRSEVFSLEGDIRWNFTKFVIDRKGDVVKRFEPAGSMDELESLIKSLL